MASRFVPGRTIPAEWLLWLEVTVGGHQSLLSDWGGSVSLAAHELACARVAARGYGKPVPNATDLRSAAIEICQRAGVVGFYPHPSTLVRDCESAGKQVV